jgi:hypothetical protein
MLDANPNQVQSWSGSTLSPNTPTPTPLVLIHDGGGTTFGYFLLGNLNRSVYALHNPNYITGQPWAGGMDEMARTYLKLIIDAGISGNIFLGGMMVFQSFQKHPFMYYTSMSLSIRIAAAASLAHQNSDTIA